MARRGIAIVLVFLSAAVVISILTIVAMYLLVGRQPSVPTRATLILKVGGDLAETAPTDVVSYLSTRHPPTVRAIVETLRKAKVDSRVQAILLEPTGFSTPYWGKIQEIRDAVLDFRASGKPVYAYLEYASDRDYYLASAADRVFLMPSSTLDLKGIATLQLFLRGTLDLIGVFPDLLHVGDYKTAVNTFTEKGYTPAHKAMDASLNASLYEALVRGIAEGRKKTLDEVRGLIDQGPFLPVAAVEVGLVDRLAYEDDARAELGRALQDDAVGDIAAEDYARVSATSLGLNRGPRIGIIYASGAITVGRSGFDPLNGATAGAETLVDAIRRARKDASLKALILRIDSPGGSATASDVIWHELVKAKEERPERPLIASMSDLAASGGYYLAMAADAIVAHPSTLTGSIGIFGGKYVTGGLYAKLGANIESTSDGQYAEIESPARPFTPEEARKVQKQLQAFYDQFVEKVATSRGKTPAEIQQVAQGRVWTGQQAHRNGLVDEIGGLDRAVALAKARAKLDPEAEVELVIFPAPKTFFEVLAEQWGAGAEQAVVSGWLASHVSAAERELLRAIRGPFASFRPGETLALMPYVVLR
ncbi:MAG: signal peptide peptidase SppA [Vicinamibacterales bacterium]